MEVLGPTPKTLLIDFVLLKLNGQAKDKAADDVAQGETDERPNKYDSNTVGAVGY